IGLTNESETGTLRENLLQFLSAGHRLAALGIIERRVVIRSGKDCGPKPAVHPRGQIAEGFPTRRGLSAALQRPETREAFILVFSETRFIALDLIGEVGI